MVGVGRDLWGSSSPTPLPNDCLYKLQGALGEHFNSFIFCPAKLCYPQPLGSHRIRKPTAFFFSAVVGCFHC